MSNSNQKFGKVRGHAMRTAWTVAEKGFRAEWFLFTNVSGSAALVDVRHAHPEFYLQDMPSDHPDRYIQLGLGTGTSNKELTLFYMAVPSGDSRWVGPLYCPRGVKIPAQASLGDAVTVFVCHHGTDRSDDTNAGWD